jgi:hypothetical protein
MKKDYPNKMAGAGESTKALKCVSECTAPGIGAWNVGDIIRDPEVIERLLGNPNFEILKEDK